MQGDIFASDALATAVELGQGASLDYFPAWLEEKNANRLFLELKNHCPWQQPTITIAGKTLAIPRLQCWYGDPKAVLAYSGQRFDPLPWLPSLQLLRERLAEQTNRNYNSVLVNLYRSGADSVSWHADDEPELGRQPVIASLSLGASRRFSLKPKPGRSRQATRHLDLNHGDLLVMRGNCQRDWHHALPKTRKTVSARINLTFRFVQPVEIAR